MLARTDIVGPEAPCPTSSLSPALAFHAHALSTVGPTGQPTILVRHENSPEAYFELYALIHSLCGACIYEDRSFQILSGITTIPGTFMCLA
ncbi:uncharacterized protein ARMOST_21670 [Armillaria ostoyae]|uniref:Uncharacterized protein n=1 Tax=Armillaria ostoyae TaxID=47428 RepID=A0A284SAS6_ARMOS|nr:uncharacterized protein ARMOST_21670 [Armillaria ostoyae]